MPCYLAMVFAKVGGWVCELISSDAEQLPRIEDSKSHLGFSFFLFSTFGFV